MDTKFFSDDDFTVDTAATIITNSQSQTLHKAVSKDSSIELLTATGQFYVMDVDDKYIVRFPKKATLKDGKSQSLEDLRLESTITTGISPYVSKTKISAVSVVDGEFPFAVHEKIKGNKLTKKDFQDLTDEQRSLFARDLAVFFAELHAVPLGKVILPDRKDLNLDNKAEAQQTLDKYGISLNNKANKQQDLVCCHNDIHAGNIGVDLSKPNILQGVFDFGMCGVTERSCDFYKVFDFDKNLCKEVIEEYNKISSQKVDIHDVEDKYLSWCAINIQMTGDKYPQIVSDMETKLKDYKQYKSLDARLNNVRAKLGTNTTSSTPRKPQNSYTDINNLRMYRNAKQNG